MLFWWGGQGGGFDFIIFLMPSIKQPTGDLYVRPLPSYKICTASFDLGVSKSVGPPPAPWDLLSHMSIFSLKDWNLCVCCSCQHSEESSCSSNENQKNWSWLYNFLSIAKRMILYTSVILEWAICFVERISSNLIFQIIQTPISWHLYGILEALDTTLIIF